jgi:hypothetical protein
MSRRKEPIPEIQNYPDPNPEGSYYAFTARPGFVGEEKGFWDGDDILIAQPTISAISHKLETITNPSETTLSWVKFFQRAVVKVRHPERFAADTPGPSNGWLDDGRSQAVEEIHGDLFPAASPQLLASASEDGFIFETVDEILSRGTVTPFMTSWLERYSVKDHTCGFNKFLIPILPLLDPDLSQAIRENKFHDFDLED